MRAIYAQFSGLAGLLAFLNQLWTYAPLDRTILVGFGAGLAVYLMLMMGDITINRILAHTPPALADEAAGARGSADKKARSKEKTAEAKAA